MKAWFEALATREQHLVSGTALFIGLTLVYLLGIEPLQQAKTDARRNASRQLALQQFIASVSAQAKNLADNASSHAYAGSLLSLMDASSKQSGIAGKVRKITPDSSDGVNLRMEAVNFDQAIGWLLELETSQGVRATNLTVSRTEGAGLVNLNVTFSR